MIAALQAAEDQADTVVVTNVQARKLPVTAIVPTYNRLALLHEALRTIEGQRARPAQVIVVDDGSTDGTSAEALREFTVDYLQLENGGKARALNHALGLARESLIWIFDDDDLAPPQALAEMYDRLSGREDLDFVFGKHMFFSVDDGKREEEWPKLPSPSSESLHLDILERCFIFQGAMLVRRRAYERVGLFDETLLRSQDYEMLTRLALNCRGEGIEAVLLHQRRHAGIRGTSAVPVPTSRVREVWRRTDKRIFTRIYNEAPISAYDLKGSRELDRFEDAQRLVRACTMARKGLIDLARNDLATLAPNQPKGLLTRQHVRSRLAHFLDPDTEGNLTPNEVGVFMAALRACLSREDRFLAALLLGRSLLRRARWSLTKGGSRRVALAEVRRLMTEFTRVWCR